MTLVAENMAATGGDIASLFPVNPKTERQEAFYAFSENYWLSHGRSLWDCTVGPLVVIQGIPEGLDEVDGFKPSWRTTSMSLDLSHRQEGTYRWHVNSDGRYWRVARTLLIDEANLSGSVEIRRKFDNGGSINPLGDLAVTRLVQITTDLASKADAERATQLRLEWY
jgi:hypothetical protein